MSDEKINPVSKAFLFDDQAAARIEKRGAAYGNALAAATLVKTARGFWFDQNHPALLALVKQKDPAAPHAAGSPLKSPVEVNRDAWGPRVWRNIHQYALKLGKITDKNRPDVLAKFESFKERIPCGECKQEWGKAQKELCAIGDNFFERTVSFHNRINVKLGKPEMTAEAAREIYAKA